MQHQCHHQTSTRLTQSRYAPLKTPHTPAPSNELAADRFSDAVSVSSVLTYTTPATHTIAIDSSFTAVSALIT